MSPDRPPPGTIPTLTEVVPWPGLPPTGAVTEPPARAEPPAAAAAGAGAPSASVSVAPAPDVSVQVEPAPVPSTAPGETPSLSLPPEPPAAITEAQLAQRVMAGLQSQVDLMLEVRLREALAPILARAGDAIVRDARKELTTALLDVVTRSVARELGRTDKP